jgi:hypothetical protein
MSFSAELPVTIINPGRENPIADVFIGERYRARVLPHARWVVDGSIAIISLMDLHNQHGPRWIISVDQQGDPVPFSSDVFDNLGPVLDAAMEAGLPFPALE